MATLRELRTKAKEMGIEYEKTTTADQLQDMIAEKMCETETAAPAAPIAEPTPAPAAAPIRRAPAVEAETAPPAEEEERKPSSFADQIAINEGDLNTEFKNQASKFASFAAAEATAKANVLTAKLRLETVDSEMTKAIRDKYAAKGEKVTEKTIQSEVIVSHEYQQAYKHWIAATRDADIARGVKEAFMQRKDMLIQLGTARRAEMDQIGMSLRDRAKEVMAKAS